MINLSKVSYGPLAEGKHLVKLQSWKLVESTESPDKSYVRLELEVIEQPGRIINDNRFEKGLDIAISQLRKQLSIPADTQLTIKDFLNSLSKNSTQFAVWLSTTPYPTNPAQSYRNYNYLPPLPVATTNQENSTTPDLETPDVM